CRSGGGLSALKLPQFIRNNPQAGSISSSTRVFSFGFQWCPQRRHIGTHTVYFNLTDNGDEDQRGPSSRLPAQKTQIPVQLKVIAP
ncbi:MAG TPA: hypothetical protein PL182_09540, partial [Pseudobdellovibrionaceae bacterium]|nr:hypothetical protein [Pseudobdellovibrionaceae bacterium]